MGLTNIAAFTAIQVVRRDIDAGIAAHFLAVCRALICAYTIDANHVFVAGIAAASAVQPVIEGIDAGAVASHLIAAVDFTGTPCADGTFVANDAAIAAILLIFYDTRASSIAHFFKLAACIDIDIDAVAVDANLIVIAFAVAGTAVFCV